MHEKFMTLAKEIAEKNAQLGKQAYGAVLVKDGEIIATAANEVEAALDPTAHAETLAVKEACKKLGTLDLKGATMYASGHPCPMCLGAMYLVNIDDVYYANAYTKDSLTSKVYEELKQNPENRTLMSLKQL